MQTFTKESFKSLLKSHSKNPKKLVQIHTLLLKTGLSVKNSLLTHLLTSLTLLDDMIYARKLFDEMHKPRPFLWNTLIKGYVKNGIFGESLLVYRQMRDLGIRPDSFTYPFVIKACADEGLGMWAGLGVHGHVVKHGLEFVDVVRTELVIMYVKFGDLGCADFLFWSMVERDLVAWNAYVSVCVQCGCADKGIALFRKMRVNAVRLDCVSVVSALSACGQLGCLETGEQIYEFSMKEGIKSNIIVENARLDMYVKCGSIDVARSLFEEMPNTNVVTWSAMIGGYAVNGESEKALALFSRMQNEGVKPNYVTFLGVLCACTHAGYVNEGRAIFNRMVHSKDRNIKPRKEHFACMVDLLGRSSLLDEAYEFIKSMPIKPDSGILGALLSACTIHHDIELGQHIADMLFELAPDIGSYNVLLSNIYAAAGRWDNVEKVRQRMRRRGVNKIAAYSSIEINGKILVLYGGDKLHSDSAKIYKTLVTQMENIGYVPKTSFVFHDVEREEKEGSLATHSKRLDTAIG